MDGDEFINAYKSQTRESETPRFNSALDLLERMSVIQRRISFLHVFHPVNKIERQKEHIELVKAYYETAIPILPKEIIDKYNKEIQNFNIEVKSFIKNGIKILHEVFSFEKEKRLREIYIDIQLSIKQYYMPKGETDVFEL